MAKAKKRGEARKRWTKEEISIKLREDDRWVKRGIIAIFKKQTADEQATHSTKHENGVGFNKIDCEFLSSLATQAIERGTLTKKQIAAGRKRILKYSQQLSRIANNEI